MNFAQKNIKQIDSLVKNILPSLPIHKDSHSKNVELVERAEKYNRPKMVLLC